MDLIWQGFLDALRLLAEGDAETLSVAARSLAVSGAATTLAAAIGVPLGIALALRRFPGRGLVESVINTGMGLPPVVVGLGVTLLLWRSGPFGPLDLIYTPMAMVLAQLIVALPLAAGLTSSSISLVEADMPGALRVDGACEWRVGWELTRAAQAQVLVAIAASFGRAIAEVGASLMVGGNIVGSTRILTTTIVLETGRGEFARAIALGIILLALAFIVNAILARIAASSPAARLV